MRYELCCKHLSSLAEYCQINVRSSTCNSQVTWFYLIAQLGKVALNNVYHKTLFRFIHTSSPVDLVFTCRLFLLSFVW